MSDVAYMLLPVVTVSNGIITACNEVFTEVIGFSSHEIVDTKLQDVLSIVDEEYQDFSCVEQLFSYCRNNPKGISVTATIKDKHHYDLPVIVFFAVC